jgi:hypothetical protein
VALLFAAGNLWFSFRRSGIPLSFDGLVERVEVFHEKHVGVDDVHLVRIDGEEVHLDAALATALRVGERVHKSRGTSRVETPRGAIDIAPSQDARRMVLAMPLIVAIAALLLLRRRVRRVDEGPAASR